MAIYHLSSKGISKSKGMNPIEAAAYRSGTKLECSLTDPKTGNVTNSISDYSHKGGVVYSKIYGPKNLPDWVFHRQKLWQAVINNENRKNPRYAKDIECALPVELTMGQNIELVKEFVDSFFTSRGLVVDVNIHNDNPNNPHLHLMLVSRTIEKVENAEEGIYDGEYKFSKNKVSFIETKPFLCMLRYEWALFCNKHLALAGHSCQISHQSFVDMGIDLTPTKHEGPSRYLKSSEIKQQNKEIVQANYEEIIAKPDLIIDLLDISRPVYTRETIKAELVEQLLAGHKMLEEDNNAKTRPEQIAQNQYLADKYLGYSQVNSLLEQVMASDKIMMVNEEDIKGNALYTKRERYELEQHFRAGMQAMNANKNHAHDISELLPGVSRKFSLNKEQEEAIKKIFAASNITSLVGLPGSGKTKTCAAIAELYKHLGYEVIGTAPTNKAAIELSNSLGIEVLNSCHLRYHWQKQRGLKAKFNLTTDYYTKEEYQSNLPALKENTILIIDEASMLDLPSCGYLTDEVRRSGAKALMVGDINQNPAIGIASAFKDVVRLGNGGELIAVQRHRDASPERQALMQEATKAMAEYKISRAIDIYEQLGMIELCETEEEVNQKLIKNYVDEVIANNQQGKGNRCSWDIGAVTNAKVNYFNNAVRERLKSAGIIRGKECLFSSGGEMTGEAVPLMKGDRIMFGSNITYFKGYGGVSNREVGVIRRIIKGEGEFNLFYSDFTDRGIFEVELDRGGKKHYVKIMTKGKYPPQFKHAYALTSHVWQGVSKDIQLPIETQGSYENYFVLFSRHINKMKIYAAKSTLEEVVYKTKDLDVERAKELYQLECYKEELGEKVEADSWRVGLRLLLSKRNKLSGALDYEYDSLAKGGNVAIVQQYTAVSHEFRELEQKRRGLENRLKQHHMQQGLRSVLTKLFNVEAPPKLDVELYRLRFAIEEQQALRKNNYNYVQSSVDAIYENLEQQSAINKDIASKERANWHELSQNKRYKLIAMSLPLSVKEQIAEIYVGLDRARDTRQQLADKIIENYFTADSISGLTAGELLVQNGHNFETVMRHSGSNTEKIYFRDREQKGNYSENYRNMLYMLHDIAGVYSEQGIHSITAGRMLELAKLAKGLQEEQREIKQAKSENKLLIERLNVTGEKAETVNDANRCFIDKEFNHYLGQIYQDSAFEVKKRWHRLRDEELFVGQKKLRSEQLNNLLQQIEDKPQLLGNIKGESFFPWLRWSDEREVAKEQIQNIASQFLRYEQANVALADYLQKYQSDKQAIESAEERLESLNERELPAKAVSLIDRLLASGIDGLDVDKQVSFDIARSEVWRFAKSEIVREEIANFEQSLLGEKEDITVSSDQQTKPQNMAKVKLNEASSKEHTILQPILAAPKAEAKAKSFFGLAAEHLATSKPFYSDADIDKAILKELASKADIAPEAKLTELYGKEAFLLRHKLIAEAGLKLVSISDEYDRRIYISKERANLEQHFTTQLSKLSKLTGHEINIEPLESSCFNQEQEAAITGALSSNNAVILQGAPGTGKTYITKEIVRQLKENGYKVLGAAQASKAASHLGAEAGLESRNLTLHRLNWQQIKGWPGEFELGVDYYSQEQYQHDTALNNKTAILVDEFSMLDLQSCSYLTDEVLRSGAKLICLGDMNQQPAIGYLGGFGTMQAKLPVYHLKQVQRQIHEDSDVQEIRRQISKDMGSFKVAKAISAMDDEGMLVKGHTSLEMEQNLIEDYSNELAVKSLECEDFSSASSFGKRIDIFKNHIIGVHTNEMANKMNAQARSKLMVIGLLDRDSEQEVEFGNSKINLAIGERVMFTRNGYYQSSKDGSAEEESVRVFNRDMAIITAIGSVGDGPEDEEGGATGQVKALLDNGQEIVIDSGGESKARLAYAYALTSHVLQGLSVEKMYIMFEPLFNFETFNVLVTRYIEQCRVYVAKEAMEEIIYKSNFKDYKAAMATHELEVYNLKSEQDGEDKDGKPIMKMVKESKDSYHLGMMLAISRFNNHMLSSELAAFHASDGTPDKRLDKSQVSAAPDILLQSKLSSLYEALRSEAGQPLSGSQQITSSKAKWQGVESSLQELSEDHKQQKEQAIIAKIENIRENVAKGGGAAEENSAEEKLATFSDKAIISEYIASRQIVRELRQQLDNYSRQFESQQYSAHLRNSIASKYGLTPPNKIAIRPHDLIEGIYHKMGNAELVEKLEGKRIFSRSQFTQLPKKEQNAIIAELLPKEAISHIFNENKVNRAARGEREKLSAELLERMSNEKFRYLLLNYNINYYTLQKHAGVAAEKYYFTEQNQSSSLARGQQGMRYLGAIKTITMPLTENRFIKELSNNVLKEQNLRQLTGSEFELLSRVISGINNYSSKLQQDILTKETNYLSLVEQEQQTATRLLDAKYMRNNLLPKLVAETLAIDIAAARNILNSKQVLDSAEQPKLANYKLEYQRLDKEINSLQEEENLEANSEVNSEDGMSRAKQIKALEQEIALLRQQLWSRQEQTAIAELKEIVDDGQMSNMAKSLAVSDLMEESQFKALENNYYSTLGGELHLSGENKTKKASSPGRRPRDVFKGKLHSAIVAKIFIDHAELLNPQDKAYIKGGRGICGTINMELKNGLWHRFSTGRGGNIVQLIEQAKNIDSKAAREYIESYISKYSNKINELESELKIEHQQNIKGRGAKGSNGANHYIVAPIAPNKISKEELIELAVSSKIAGKSTALYPYRNIDGQLIGYTARFEHEGKKQVLPLAYTKSTISNNGKWALKGFSDGEYKPIYGAEKLLANQRPILIVEGEKAADFAAKAYNKVGNESLEVISWLGGSSSADKARWQLIAGREVIIWPDNDVAGQSAAIKIRREINKANGVLGLVQIVDTSKLELPKGWDLADELPANSKLSQDSISKVIERSLSNIRSEINLNDARLAKITNLISKEHEQIRLVARGKENIQSGVVGQAPSAARQSASFDVRKYQLSGLIDLNNKPKAALDNLLAGKASSALELIITRESTSVKQTYRERLASELAIISGNGLSYDVLMASNIKQFCRDNNIATGTGRGSSSCSLVAHMVGIHEVDPIKYNLPFERFLTSNASSLPDFDIDVAASRKDEVMSFMLTHYPDSARIKTSDGKLHNSAIMLVSKEEITQHGLEVTLGANNERVINITAKEADKLKLHKYDILPLVMLDKISLIESKIAASHGELINWSLQQRHGMMHDVGSFDLVRRKDVAGIFQLGGEKASKKIANMPALACNNFADLVNLQAEIRPGANNVTGATNFKDPKGVLSSSQGRILFEEQIMQLGAEYLGLNGDEANSMMRGFVKGKENELAASREVFIAKGLEAGIVDGKQLGQLYDMLAQNKGYNYNKAHSVAYSMLSFKTLYLKAHYRTEFEQVMQNKVIASPNLADNTVMQAASNLQAASYHDIKGHQYLPANSAIYKELLLSSLRVSLRTRPELAPTIADNVNGSSKRQAEMLELLYNKQITNCSSLTEQFRADIILLATSKKDLPIEEVEQGGILELIKQQGDIIEPSKSGVSFDYETELLKANSAIKALSSQDLATYQQAKYEQIKKEQLDDLSYNLQSSKQTLSRVKELNSLICEIATTDALEENKQQATLFSQHIINANRQDIGTIADKFHQELVSKYATLATKDLTKQLDKVKELDGYNNYLSSYNDMASKLTKAEHELLASTSKDEALIGGSLDNKATNQLQEITAKLQQADIISEADCFSMLKQEGTSPQAHLKLLIAKQGQLQKLDSILGANEQKIQDIREFGQSLDKDKLKQELFSIKEQDMLGYIDNIWQTSYASYYGPKAQEFVDMRHAASNEQTVNRQSKQLYQTLQRELEWTKELGQKHPHLIASNELAAGRYAKFAADLAEHQGIRQELKEHYQIAAIYSTFDGEVGKSAESHEQFNSAVMDGDLKQVSESLNTIASIAVAEHFEHGLKIIEAQGQFVDKKTAESAATYKCDIAFTEAIIKEHGYYLKGPYTPEHTAKKIAAFENGKELFDKRHIYIKDLKNIGAEINRAEILKQFMTMDDKQSTEFMVGKWLEEVKQHIEDQFSALNNKHMQNEFIKEPISYLQDKFVLCEQLTKNFKIELGTKAIDRPDIIAMSKSIYLKDDILQKINQHHMVMSDANLGGSKVGATAEIQEASNISELEKSLHKEVSIQLSNHLDKGIEHIKQHGHVDIAIENQPDKTHSFSNILQFIAHFINHDVCGQYLHDTNHHKQYQQHQEKQLELQQKQEQNAKCDKEKNDFSMGGMEL